MAEKQPIQLPLSARELKLLVELMYISHWVVCAGEEFADRGYQTAVENLEQKIYQLAVEHGPTNLVEREPDDTQYFPTRFLEEESKAREAIRTRDEENFWEELIDRLATIGAEREAGPNRWKKMSHADRLRAIRLHDGRVRAALGKHGLQGLTLLSAESAQ